MTIPIQFKKVLFFFLLFFLCNLSNLAFAQTEILLNGSAESNTVTINEGSIDDWIEELEEWAANDPSGLGLGFSAQDGSNVFIPQSTDNGSSTRIWVLSQTVDVSSDATAIDAGNVTIDFSGYFQSASSDLGRIRIQFLNSSDGLIEEYDTGFISNEGSWQNLTDSRTAPNGTRSIKVILEGDNSATGLFADAAFDNLSLIKTVTATNTAPTTADATVYTVVDTEYAFSDSDFPYSDGDSDPLSVVEITTLPGSGTLYLDGNNNDTNEGEDVSEDDDISLSDLQNGHLRYDPPSGTTGYQAVSFTFSVGDGTDFSSPSTMNISLDADEVTINGTNGEDEWHLISNPYDSNLSNLLSSIWTQGSSNADFASGTPNVYTYDETNQQYSAVGDLGTSPSAGAGHLVLFYADNDAATGGIQGNWPKTISTSGTPNNGTVNISVQNTDDDGSSTLTDDEGWNLVGNPYGTNISVDAVITALDNAFGAVNGSVYIWDALANSGSGDFESRSSGEAISPFQAFFVRLETPGESGSFSLDNTARTSTAATFLKEPQPDFPKIILSAKGAELSDQLTLYFKDNGDLLLDRDDAYKLPSLSSEYLQFFSLVRDQSIAVNNLPFQFDEKISIPLYLNSTQSGVFNIQPTLESVPDQWHLELQNIKTGNRTNLRETSDLSFEYNSTIRKKDQNKTGLQMEKIEPNNHVFNLVISPSKTGIIDEETPERFTLEQNYPNPFNPTTRIEYNLPEQSSVSIKIYDMMGREIDTLLNEQMPAGTHQVVWNGNNRSSGIYIYRLETSGVTFTKKMTLIK